MKICFSASTLWFYDLEEKEQYAAGVGWPTDAVEISNEEWKAYTQISPEGYILGSDSSGKPAWVLVPPPTHEEEVSEAEQYRQLLLRQIDEVTADWRVELMLGDISDEDKANLTEWMAYKKEVKAVDTSTAPDVTWPEPPAA